MTYFLRLAAIAIVLLVVALLLLRSYAHNSLFPVPKSAVPPAPRGWKDLLLVQSGTFNWVFSGPSEGPIIIFLHGNGEHLGTLQAAGLLTELENLGTVVVHDYPGYGKSQGKPSEASLVEAATELTRWVDQQFPDRPRVLVGWSLGAGVAAQVADADAWVLLSPWTSLRRVSTDHFPDWLVPWAVPAAFDTASVIQRRQPLLLVSGEQDNVIPTYHAQELATLSARDLFLVPGAGHDVVSHPQTWAAIQSFVNALAPPDP